MIIADKSYEVSDPTIDSQIVALQDSGADIFLTWAAPKGAAQAIRKVGELGWKPKFFLANVSTSVATVLKPAGLEQCQGHHLDRLSEGSDRSGLEGRSGRQDLAEPSWTKYYPGRRQDQHQQRLRLCDGADHGSGPEAVRRRSHARERHEAGRQPEGISPATCCCPGIKINTGPDDFFPIEQMQLMKFNGEAGSCSATSSPARSATTPAIEARLRRISPRSAARRRAEISADRPRRRRSWFRSADADRSICRLSRPRRSPVRS